MKVNITDSDLPGRVRRIIELIKGLSQTDRIDFRDVHASPSRDPGQPLNLIKKALKRCFNERIVKSLMRIRAGAMICPLRGKNLEVRLWFFNKSVFPSYWQLVNVYIDKEEVNYSEWKGLEDI